MAEVGSFESGVDADWLECLNLDHLPPSSDWLTVRSLHSLYVDLNLQPIALKNVLLLV